MLATVGAQQLLVCIHQSAAEALGGTRPCMAEQTSGYELTPTTGESNVCVCAGSAELLVADV